MKPELVRRLLALNTAFYQEVAASFAATRNKIWPGLDCVRQYLMERHVCTHQVLDAGCGNGRLFPFVFTSLSPQGYVGVDANAALLCHARARASTLHSSATEVRFLQADLADPTWTAQLGARRQFNIVFCLATLHHMPGWALRSSVLASLARTLVPGGLLVLSNWQPHHSARQRRKIVDWSVLQVPVSAVEAGDCLITWSRDVQALRYVHILNREEVAQLACANGLRPLVQFEADGETANLNLYSILHKI